jgi:hypothetical protein
MAACAALAALVALECVASIAASEFDLLQNMAYLQPIVNAAEDVVDALFLPKPVVGVVFGRGSLQKRRFFESLKVLAYALSAWCLEKLKARLLDQRR